MSSMKIALHLLWIDCLAGALVGAVVAGFHDWFSALFGLPVGLVQFMGIMNLAYAALSFSLAASLHRPLWRFRVLVVANVFWSLFCLAILAGYWRQASLFGIGQLLAEAVFVGGLGALEWNFRKVLNIDEGLGDAGEI